MRVPTSPPWEAVKQTIGGVDLWFVQKAGATIALLNTPCLLYNNAEADAYLIAQAPALRKTLRAIVGLIEGEGESQDGRRAVTFLDSEFEHFKAVLRVIDGP